MRVKILTYVLLLGIIAPSHGVCKSGQLTAYETVVLDAHNKLREKHQDTRNLCYGVSGDDVTFTSQSWAETRAAGAMGHSSGGNGVYGENMAYNGRTLAVAPKDEAYESAVSRWYAEIDYWDFDTSTKAASAGSEKTGHFTQVVWTDSVQVNCGYATFVKEKEQWTLNSNIVVCQYYPRGNYNNNYATKVLPLKDNNTDDNNTDDDNTDDDNTDDDNTDDNNIDTYDVDKKDDDSKTPDDNASASVVSSAVLFAAAALRVAV